MLTRIGLWCIAWLNRATPWSNVYGVGRTLIALAHLLTFVVCDSTTLFHPTSGTSVVPYGQGLARYGLFHLMRDHLDLARACSVVLLAITSLGWRPRVTGIAHAYVAWSFANNASLIEGGEQIALDLALLLVPVTLTDPRRWHWVPAPPRPVLGYSSVLQKLAACLALVAVRLQVSGVYLQASTSKFAVREWADGTALHYFAWNHTFGPTGWVRVLALWAFDQEALLAIATWGVLLVELALAAGLIIEQRWWRYLLCAGVLLHTGIVLLHGLVSFGLIMTGALVLYVRSKNEPFVWPGSVQQVLCHLAEKWQQLSAASHPAAHRSVEREQHYPPPR